MARDINQVFIIGRLVKDPEIRYTPSGTPVTKFSLANNSSFMQNNEKKEYVNYFDVNVWGNQAVSCEKYLKKGKMVAVVGTLRQNRWVDKTSNQTRSKVEITALSVQFLSPVGTVQPVQNSMSNTNIKQEQNTDNNADPWSDSWQNEEGGSFEETPPDDIPF